MSLLWSSYCFRYNIRVFVFGQVYEAHIIFNLLQRLPALHSLPYVRAMRTLHIFNSLLLTECRSRANTMRHGSPEVLARGRCMPTLVNTHPCSCTCCSPAAKVSSLGCLVRGSTWNPSKETTKNFNICIILCMSQKRPFTYAESQTYVSLQIGRTNVEFYLHLAPYSASLSMSRRFMRIGANTTRQW